VSGLWAVHCLDGPHAADRRAELLAAHSARLKEVREAPGGVRLVVYGPLLAGGAHAGSLFVLAADGPEDVDRFVAEDPFALGGVWDRVDVHEFGPSANSLVDVTDA
jgi:uncharacterized protein YciI